MTALMAEESRFQIVFAKLSEVRPEQWEPAQSEAEVQALRKASEEIAELRRELLEITEPPVSLFTTT
jgi:hypothetical protein